MRKTDAFRRAAALMAALSITVSLAAPAFAGTYYIDNGDITITRNENGTRTITQNGEQVGMDAAGDETIITTKKNSDGTQAGKTENEAEGKEIITTVGAATATLESDLEGPAAEDTGFDPVVEDNYQPAAPAQPEDADQPESPDQPEDAEESEDAEEPKGADQQKDADQQESADRQAQPQQAAPAAAAAPARNIITVINNFANTVLNLTLKDVKIDVSDTGNDSADGKAAMSVQGKGNVEIELDGKNELKSGWYRAGLEKNASEAEGTLTLKDDNKEAGSLTAEGGEDGAGIGGGYAESGENITINGGRVTAAGGEWGAGIGGGRYGSGKNITINGGTVNATGGWAGAGIGGGDEGGGKNITINSGTVTAQGGLNGAGIGGGEGGGGQNIKITGGTVTAYGEGDDWSAGIGGGGGGSGEDITITGGTVTAKGGALGAGIGGGGGGRSGGSGQNIKITGGTVNASGWAGAGIGGGINGSGINVTVSGAAQVTVTASKGDDWDSADTGATIGNGGSATRDGDLVNGEEIQADISGLTTGYIHHIIYNLDGSVKREWWEYGHLQPAPDGPNAPAEESNGVSLGTPWLHVETLEGDPLPFNAQQQGSTLTVTSDTLAARLHGTREALEALQEQGVEQIQFVTTLKTTTLSVEDLLAEGGGSWFALEHNGLVSRQLSAAQAESLKCRMR